jgi:predicted dehydrogenase
MKKTRREFIKSSIGPVAAFTIIPRSVLGGSGFTAPSDTVNVAVAGAGGQSWYSIRELMKLNDVKLISVADPGRLWKNDILYNFDTGRGPAKKFIDDFYSEKGQKSRISEFEDFRIMMKKEKSLDAIVCASPDNTHAYISIMAMRAGKHVYCEKPLTHNIWEARKVREVAHETKLATQMGNQLHSSDAIRQTVEYLRSGVIGKVLEAHSWVGATRWWPELKGLPSDVTPVPEGFNWDLWLGPTLSRPYNKAYSPVKWRDFWTFGCGALGDFGCHDLDSTTWAFNLKSPYSVEVLPAGNRGSAEIAPYGEIGYYTFREKGEQKPLKLICYSGGLMPEHHELIPDNIQFTGRGAMFIGEKGIILNNGGATAPPKIFPESLAANVPQTLPRSKGHHREWIDAIKGGPAAMSNFEYASKLTEITLLGVLSLRLGGRKIYWDDVNMKATGIPEADAIIREPVRGGWEMV